MMFPDEIVSKLSQNEHFHVILEFLNAGKV